VALLILAAVSGTGKSTIARRLLARRANLRVSVSHTTRAPREGETDGVHYHFVSRETFEDMVAAGAFAEWAEYVGNLYGTARATIDAAEAAGLDLVFDIDVQGARHLKAAYPNSIGCFLLPPSWATLRGRLERRGTDAKEVIERRLQRGRVELGQAASFDHLVVNDDLEEAVAEVARLIVGGTSRPSLRRGLLHGLIAEAEVDSALGS
jgi:guanylate kinase